MIIWLCKYCWFLINYYLYRRNPRVLYSRSILRSMPITSYVSCMLRKQVSSPQGAVKNQKRMLRRGGSFFLDGQCSDDEYFSAISFITPIRVVTYTKENDLCLRVIQKRKTIYTVFCICMQYKCLIIQFVSMWYFIILNVNFCKELISCLKLFPVLAIAPDVTQIHGSRPCKTKGCFVVIVVVEMTVLGRTGEDLYLTSSCGLNLFPGVATLSTDVTNSGVEYRLQLCLIFSENRAIFISHCVIYELTVLLGMGCLTDTRSKTREREDKEQGRKLNLDQGRQLYRRKTEMRLSRSHSVVLRIIPNSPLWLAQKVVLRYKTFSSHDRNSFLFKMGVRF